MSKKLGYNKTAKGLVSLITIVLLLSSILASSIFYENNITANAVRETSADSTPTNIQIIEVNDVKELNQLNEGWYQVVNGYVFYLEHFDSYAPLYIHVKDLEQQNALLGVDEDGTLVFDNVFGNEDAEEQIIDQEAEVDNQITGKVTGFEGVSGFGSLVVPTSTVERDLCIYKLGNRCVKDGEMVYDVRGKEWTAKKTFWTGSRVIKDSEGSTIDPTPVLGVNNEYFSNQAPSFRDSRNGEVIPQQGDKFTRKEGNAYVPWTYSINENGYRSLNAPDGRRIEFGSQKIDLSEWYPPTSRPPYLPSVPEQEYPGFTGFQRGNDMRVSANSVQYNMDVSSEFQPVLAAARQPQVPSTTASSTVFYTDSNGNRVILENRGTFWESQDKKINVADSEVQRGLTTGEYTRSLPSAVASPPSPTLGSSPTPSPPPTTAQPSGAAVPSTTVPEAAPGASTVAPTLITKPTASTSASPAGKSPLDSLSSADRQKLETLPKAAKGSSQRIVAYDPETGSYEVLDADPKTLNTLKLEGYNVVLVSGALAQELSEPSNPLFEYRVKGNEIRRIESLPSQVDYAAVTILDTKGKEKGKPVVVKYEEAEEVQVRATRDNLVLGQKLTDSQARILLGKSGNEPIDSTDMAELASLLESGKFQAQSNGVMTVSKEDGQTLMYIPPGKTHQIAGTTFTAPKDKPLEIVNLEGNQFQIDGKNFVLHQGRLFALEKETSGANAGMFEYRDPKNPTKSLYMQVTQNFDPKNFVKSSAAAPSADSKILQIGTLQGIVQFSVDGLGEEQIELIKGAIPHAQTITDKEIIVQAENKKTTYTRDKIVEEIDGKVSKETTFKTAKGNAKVKIEKEFDETGKAVKSVKIGGIDIPADDFSKIEKQIKWETYEPKAANTFSLGGDKGIKIEPGIVTYLTKDKPTKIIKTEFREDVSKSVKISTKTETNFAADGVTKSSETVTTITDKGFEKVTEKTETAFESKDKLKSVIAMKSTEGVGGQFHGSEKTVHQYKDGEIASTVYEKVTIADDGSEIKLAITQNGKLDPTQALDTIGKDARISFDGNLISVEKLKGLTGAVNIGDIDEFAMSDATRLLSEAKSMGINIQNAEINTNLETKERTIKSNDGSKLVSFDGFDLQFSEYSRGQDGKYGDRLARRITRSFDGSVEDFACKEKNGCTSASVEEIENQQFTATYYNYDSKEITKTVSTLKQEDRIIKTEVEYKNPNDPLKNSLISKIKIGGDELALDTPDQRGYQKVTSTGWNEVWYREGKFYTKQEKDKLLGEGKEEIYVQLTDENFLKWQKILQDAGVEGQDHKRKADSLRAKLTEKERTEALQQTTRAFFAEVERVLSDFQGLGYYSTLFLDEDSLLKWRDSVDRIFATLYLGTEYWSSAICGQYLDGEEEGIAYAETPQGLTQIGAHIEATRSEPIITPDGTEFNYRITFNVRNGDFDKDTRAPSEMKVNVVLKGERTVSVFKEDQSVKRGSSFGRTGRNAIAKASSAFYNEVCLTFDETPLRWKVSNNEICNVILEASGEPTTSSGSGSSSSPSSGGSSGDVNDF